MFCVCWALQIFLVEVPAQILCFIKVRLLNSFFFGGGDGVWGYIQHFLGIIPDGAQGTIHMWCHKSNPSWLHARQASTLLYLNLWPHFILDMWIQWSQHYLFKRLFSLDWNVLAPLLKLIAHKRLGLGLGRWHKQEMRAHILHVGSIPSIA